MERIRKLLRLRLARFVLVGGGSAALLMALTWGMMRAGVAPFAAGLLGYAVSFAVAYTLQRNWTFEGAGRHSRTLPRYFTLQAGCALATGGLSHLLASRLGWTPLAASAVTTLCASAISYFGSSLWVFADAPE